MPSLEERDIQCPYCGESISVLVDSSEAGAEYVEDCQVCCRPIEFSVFEDMDGTVTLQVRTDHD
jgi:transcription elongation factor Elf1